MAMSTITVPADYGYVVLIALGIIPVLSFAQGSVVGYFRGKANCPYPNMYASAQEAKEKQNAYTFNCAQRAHGHLIENMPQTIASMLVAGLVHPRATAVFGAGWVVSRILFAYGYIASNKPKGNGRYLGATFWLAQAALWGMSIHAGFQLLKGGAI